MKALNTSFFLTILFAGMLFFSCNFKKIPLEAGICLKTTALNCANGITYSLDASCANADSVVWTIQDEPAPIVGAKIDYNFPNPQKYSVNLLIKKGSISTDTTFIIDAGDLTALSFSKKLTLAESQIPIDMAVLPDGGYAICGYTNNGSNKAFVTWTDANGEVIRHQTYLPPGVDSSEAFSIVSNGDGSITIAGRAIFGGKDQLYVAKIDENGLSLINKVIEDTFPRRAFSIDRIASTGKYLICGHRADNPATNGQDFFVKLTTNLDVSASTQTGNAGAFKIKSIGMDAFLLVGSRYVPFDGTYLAFPPLFHVSKWPSTFSDDWGLMQTSLFNSTTEEKRGFNVLQLQDGTIVACGDFRSNATSKRQIWLEHYASNGMLLNFFPLPKGTRATDLVEASDGGGVILACASSESVGVEQEKDQGFLLMKVNLATKMAVWTRDNIAVPGVIDYATAIKKTACGYIVLGRTGQNETGNETSSWLVRTDLNGN